MKALVTTVAVLAVLVGPAYAAETTISQSTDTGYSGDTNGGQEFQVNTSQPAFAGWGGAVLKGFTFWRGGLAYLGDNGDAVYLDVYSQGTFSGDPDFSSGSAPAGIEYLGSSDNAMDFDGTGDGTRYDWTFSSIQLPVDTRLYVLLSDDDADGGIASGSLRMCENVKDSLDFTNIANADSNPLWDMAAGTTLGDIEDNRYEAVVDVPEPATMALLALGGLGLIRRRRKA